MASRRFATAAAYRFASASMPPVKALAHSASHRPCAPFYGPQSPARGALKEVLATLHDAAHRAVPDQSASRGSGVCVVGNKGTGTTTLLEVVAAATRTLLPQYDRVVCAKADKTGHSNTWLHELVDDRLEAGFGTCAVFVDDAQYLDANDWNNVRHLLRPSGVRTAEGTFVHDPKVCVVVGGDFSLMTGVKEYEAGNVHEYFARATVQPMQTLAQYRAFHAHVRASLAPSCGEAASSGIVEPTDAQVAAAAWTWHLMTGGNFGALHGMVDAACIAGARRLRAQTSDQLWEALRFDTAAAACVEFMRRKLQAKRSGDAFCPFEAGALTASSDELHRAMEPWFRARRRAGDFYEHANLEKLCAWGFLRIAGDQDPTCYALNRPYLGATLREWSTLYSEYR
jgi:hypothetical protein